MKRIAILLTNDIHYDRRMLRIVKSLSSKYKIAIFSQNKYDITSDNQYYNLHEIKTLFKRGFLFYFEFNIRLFIKLITQKFDIVYAVDYDTIIPAALMGKIKRKKIVLDAHELFEESIEIVNRPMVKRFWTRIGRIFIPRIDLGITVSKSIANYYNEKFSKTFKVVRNIPEFYPSVDSYSKQHHSPKVILYQGVLNEGRKLEMLIDSAVFLGDQYKISIVGEGDLSESLRLRAIKSNSLCKIEFHSWVAPENLRNHTEKAYLGYNLLSEDSPSYYYSLANKFFDYLHAGIPSLNSNFPEYSRINDEYDCCYLLNVDNGKHLAEYILALDNNEYDRKKRNCILACNILNWQEEEKELVKLIESIA